MLLMQAVQGGRKQRKGQRAPNAPRTPRALLELVADPGTVL